MTIEFASVRKCEVDRRWALVRLLPCAVVMICIQLLASEASANQYRAFYYDASGLLIQIEDVPDEQLQHRILMDVEETLLSFPMLTKEVTPLLTGNKIPMSRFATIAVYYTYAASQQGPQDGDENVPAFPDKVEYLGTVRDRTLMNCVARASTDPCLYPRRCHCGFGTCCCY